MFHVQNIVGPRVGEARRARKPSITQKDLASALQLEGWDVSRVGVAKIESQIRQMTDAEVMLLAKVLQVPIEWLFGAED